MAWKDIVQIKFPMKVWRNIIEIFFSKNKRYERRNLCIMTNIILIVAIILFVVSLGLSVKEPTVAATLLNFLSSVVASWLISNKANEKEAKKKQEGLAKVSHRHLGDVEKSALSIEQYIKDFTYDFTTNEQNLSHDAILLFLKSLDSRMDDLKDRITSTNRDWYDLLADSVKKEIKDAEDPEATTIKDSITMPDLSSMTKYGQVANVVLNGTADDLRKKGL